jgi:predicted RNA-binding protein
MCLAKAYLGQNDNSELLLENVTSIKVENNRLVLTSLFGEKKEIAGSIREIDFRSSRVILETLSTSGVLG